MEQPVYERGALLRRPYRYKREGQKLREDIGRERIDAEDPEGDQHPAPAAVSVQPPPQETEREQADAGIHKNK